MTEDPLAPCGRDDLKSAHWIPDDSGPPLLVGATVGGRLRQIAAEVPDRIALVEGAPTAERRRWTYKGLLADAENCARFLLKHFEPSEHIAVCADNVPEWLVLQYGVAVARLTLVMLNPSPQPAELRYVLRQSLAVGVFTVPEVRGNPLIAHVDSICSELVGLRSVMRLDLLTELTSHTEAGEFALPTVESNDPTQTQYTSGTTGFAKVAMLRHGSIVNNARLWAHRVAIRDGASWLLANPLFHIGGSVLGVLGSLDRRAKLVLMPAFESGRCLELIEQEKVWFAGGVSSMLIAAVELPEVAERDLSSWQATMSGGAQVPERLVQRLEVTLGLNVTSYYGQTECGVLTSTSPSDSAHDKSVTAGQPLPHTELRLVDPVSLSTVTLDRSGEIWARGYFSMLGYFDDPQSTNEPLREGDWVRTGDVATMDQRGYLSIVGRLKDMIIRGGENLFPSEIEGVLYHHPAVAEVAVVGLPDDHWGETVGAFIRPTDAKSPPTINELRSYIRIHLLPQKTPTRWYGVSGYPLNRSGKIQKFIIREAWGNGEYDGDELPTTTDEAANSLHCKTARGTFGERMGRRTQWAKGVRV